MLHPRSRTRPGRQYRSFRSGARALGAAAFLAVTVGLGATACALDASAASPARGRAQCRVTFQASTLHLEVGQTLVLTWSAVGADTLTASWTSAGIPLAGSFTTTMRRAGRVSYQVTATAGGRYCGGAGVAVEFTGAPSAAATTTGARTTTTAPAATPGSSAPAPAPGPTTYPAQSPTGGRGVGWFQRPANLLGLGGLAMLASLLLWKQERVRAAVRRH